MFVAPHHYGGFREEAMASPLLLDMAIHTFDQARFLLGADPVSVSCHEFNPRGSWYAGYAAAICEFEFSDGSVFSYRGSWVAEGLRTSYNGVWRVTGTRGSAGWDGAQVLSGERAVPPAEPSYFWPTEPLAWPVLPEPLDATHHAEAIAAILPQFQPERLASGERPETDCADNARSLAMVLAAMHSSRVGHRVRLAEVP